MNESEFSTKISVFADIFRAKNLLKRNFAKLRSIFRFPQKSKGPFPFDYMPYNIQATWLCNVYGTVYTQYVILYMQAEVQFY